LEHQNVEGYMNSVVKILTDDGSHGSGFFIDEKGLILTNQHVVDDFINPEIGLHEGSTFKGTVIESSATLDLALVKIDGFDSASRFLSLSSLNKIKIGEDIFTIGHPVVMDENKETIKGDWIAEFGKYTSNYDDDIRIKHNIDLYGGNSGGPIVRSGVGTVIGIVDSHYGASNWSSAIRSDVALNWLSSLQIALPPSNAVESDIIPESPALPTEYNKSFKFGLAAGRSSGTYSRMGDDLKQLVATHKIELNVITDETNPSTSGSIKNVELLNRDGCCQLAFVQSDVLQHYERTGRSEYTNNLRFLFPLHTEEVHVISRKNISSINDLKKHSARIAVDTEDTGTYITANAILSELGIRQEAYVNKGGDEALGMLMRGAIDAMFYVAGYPSNFLTSINSDELQLLEISGNELDAIVGRGGKLYQPTVIPGKDGHYKGWLDRSVPTVNVKAMLMTFKYENDNCPGVQRFFSVVNNSYNALLGPDNRHWESVNFYEEAPIGWKRFDPNACK